MIYLAEFLIGLSAAGWIIDTPHTGRNPSAIYMNEDTPKSEVKHKVEEGAFVGLGLTYRVAYQLQDGFHSIELVANGRYRNFRLPKGGLPDLDVSKMFVSPTSRRNPALGVVIPYGPDISGCSFAPGIRNFVALTTEPNSNVEVWYYHDCELKHSLYKG